MIEAVIFDLDGVLIDSEPVWEDVRRTVVAEHGGRWADDAQQRLMGMSTGEWAAYLSHELGVGLPPAEVADLVIGRMAERYADKLPLLPGAEQAVRELAAGWPLGLASSSPPVLIDTVLRESGLSAAFAATMSTELVPRGKPAPDIYLAVAQRLGHPATASAAIEDSANGLRSAAAAGLTVIAVPHPRYPPGPEALGLATVVLDGLNGLTAEVIRGLD